MSNYNKHPFVEVKGFHNHAKEGYEAIVTELKPKFETKKDFILVIDTYPGVDYDEVVKGLGELSFNKVIYADDMYINGNDISNKIKDDLTNDRVFGRMTTKSLNELIDEDKRLDMLNIMKEKNGPILLIGVGASLITKGDCFIYADLARWEIQLRYRQGMSNWKIENSNDSKLTKYKRGFFFEWRIADRHKKRNFNEFDYLLDTNVKNSPKMVTGEAFREGLRQTAKQPYRGVPYFDAGVWGGQWMKEVCGLDSEMDNYAWSFDGVPEENSLYLKYGSIRVEVPSIDVVLYQPIQLLGTKVHARFGAEFPIRFDLLDTMSGQNLSLQVHPITEYIQEKFGINYTQDESYYILDASEDANVYLGVKSEIDIEKMKEELIVASNGEEPFQADKYINKFPAKKHDHFLIPAGTIHCSGANTMVLEISATPYIFTFKLWDWERVGLDGLPRPIHLEHGFNVIDWGRDTKWVSNQLVNQVEEIKSTNSYTEERTGLHEREFIETRRYWIKDEVKISTFDSVNVLNLVEGKEAVVESLDNSFEPFVVHYAETFIIPESVKEYIIKPYGESQGKEIGVVRAYVRT